MPITEELKKEVGKFLDDNRIKAVFYSEKCREGGAYHVIYADEDGDWYETMIKMEVENE